MKKFIVISVTVFALLTGVYAYVVMSNQEAVDDTAPTQVLDVYFATEDLNNEFVTGNGSYQAPKGNLVFYKSGFADEAVILIGEKYELTSNTYKSLLSAVTVIMGEDAAVGFSENVPMLADITYGNYTLECEPELSEFEKRIFSDDTYNVVKLTIDKTLDEDNPFAEISLQIGSSFVAVTYEDGSYESLPIDVAPMIVEERTFLPIRVIAEIMEMEVAWEDETKTATLTKDDNSIVITIGRYVASANGQEVVLDSPAIIVEERALLPVRFIVEALNCEVKWDDIEKKLKITPFSEQVDDETMTDVTLQISDFAKYAAPVASYDKVVETLKEATKYSIVGKSFESLNGIVTINLQVYKNNALLTGKNLAESEGYLQETIDEYLSPSKTYNISVTDNEYEIKIVIKNNN